MTALDPQRSAVLPAGMYTPWAVPYPAVVPAPVLPAPAVQASMAEAGALETGPEPTRRTRLAQYLRGDRALPQLGRFALVGGASNIAYILLFAAMYGMGSITANIAGSAVSTVLANELHRRLTFKAADRVHWFTAQWEAGGLAVLGLVITTCALAALEVFTPTLGGSAQAAAVLAITAAVGGMRFLALRGFVF